MRDGPRRPGSALPDGSRTLLPDGGDEDDEPLRDLAERLRARRTERERREGDDREGAGTDPDDAEESHGFDFEHSDSADDDGGAESGVFEEMEIADVDTEDVWEAVLSDEDDTAGGPTEATAGGVTAAAAVSDDVGDVTDEVETAVGADHIVPKDDYCESCRFFSAPPDVACLYEGSEVVEVVDTEQFRVRNCPVVDGLLETDGTTAGGDSAGDGDSE